MTPEGVTQTLFADTDGRLGNCLPACVATFLDIDLEQVPHFIEWGAALTTGDHLAWESDHRCWIAMLMGFAFARGFAIEVLGGLDDAEPGEVVFVAGMSTRGVMHQVLYRDGSLWWDPHPSREGVLSIETVEAWRACPAHDHGEAS